MCKKEDKKEEAKKRKAVAKAAAAKAAAAKAAPKAAAANSSSQAPPSKKPKTEPSMPEQGAAIQYRGATIHNKGGYFRIYIPKSCGVPKAIDCNKQQSEGAAAAFKVCVAKIDDALHG